MSRRLFTVTDAFLIPTRGLVLVPGMDPVNDKRFRVGDPLVLKRPDGSQIRTTIAGLERFTCTTKPEIPVRLKELGKDDVPVGTEVWSVSDDTPGR